MQDVSKFDSAKWPNVAPCRGSSLWSSPCAREQQQGSRIWSASGMEVKQQRLRMRHGVPDVKMLLKMRHKHKLEP